VAIALIYTRYAFLELVILQAAKEVLSTAVGYYVVIARMGIEYLV
jgi:hypothetical protein